MITGLFAALALMDFGLALWGFVFPDFWFEFFHQLPLQDPIALLSRCAANWLAFAILQGLAMLRWKRETWWLPLVAGCRFGDSLTDLTCLLAAEQVTLMAWIAFPAAGLGNLLLGMYLIRHFQSLAPKN